MISLVLGTNLQPVIEISLSVRFTVDFFNVNIRVYVR